jgi:hypothetical protein
MSNPWTKLVQEKFRLGRLNDPVFSLKQAMKSAKLVYKKGVSAAKNIGTRRRGGSRKRRKTRGKR